MIGEDYRGEEFREYRYGDYVLVFNTKEDAHNFIKQHKRFEFTSRTKSISTVSKWLFTDEKGCYFGEVLIGSYIVVYHPHTRDTPVIKGPVKKSRKTFDFKFNFGGGFPPPPPPKKKKRTKPEIADKLTNSFADDIVWNLNFVLPGYYSNNHSRLIIRPYVMSCEDATDTVAVLNPIVIEGKKYIRARKDTLHKYCDKEYVLSKEELHINKAISIKRPHPKKMYYCTADIVLEDYTHTIWTNKGDKTIYGSCYTITPFKFLELNHIDSQMPSDTTAHQALKCLKLGELNKARTLISKLTEYPELQKELTCYIDMINLVNHWDNPNLLDEDREKGMTALDYVMSSNKTNRAILSAELHKELEIDRIKAFHLVDTTMADTDARKWYLLGMLISEYVGDESDVLPKPLDGIPLHEAYNNGLRVDSLTAENVALYRELTTWEDMDLPMDLTLGSDGMFFQVLRDKYAELMKEVAPKEEKVEKKPENTTPYFLAFMQHAFDLNPDLMRYYFHEGNISKHIHNKYTYKKSEAEKYREKFKMIQVEHKSFLK